MIIDTNQCWYYAGNISSNGYGRLWTGDAYEFVHRLMWEDAHSRVIPEGLQIDHLCRVRCCINPAHLEAVTPRENNLRGLTIGARLASRDSCKYGHKFDKANTRLDGNTRKCRACARNWQREFRANNRSE